METKTIQLEGIRRNDPDNIVVDGACQEIINARFRDGAWRPIGSKKTKFNFAHPAKNILFHQINPDHYAYVYQSSSSPVWGAVRARIYYQGTYQSEQLIKDYGSDKELKFSAQGTVLIINNITDNKLETAWYDTENKEYNYIGNLLPQLPNILVESEDTGEYEEFSTVMNVTKEGAFAAYLANDVEMQKEGWFTGYTIVRYGFELFDGSFVHHSHPIAFGHGYAEVKKYQPAENWMYLFKVKKFKNKITVSESVSVCDNIKNNYKNIIRGIRIFMVRPWQMYASIGNPGTEEYSEMGKDATFSYETLLPGRPDYYDCGFISIDQITQEETYYIANKNLNDLSFGKNMGVNPGDFHNISSKALYNYNDRTFYGLIKSRLFEGFMPYFFVFKTLLYFLEGADYKIALEVDLKTKEGDKHVRSGWHTINYWSSNPTDHREFWIPRYLSYPDSRATKLRILVKDINAVRDGEFNTSCVDPIWTCNTGWAITGGKAGAAAATTNLVQSGACKVGKTYKVKWSLIDYTSGEVRVCIGTSCGAWKSAVELDIEEEITATDNGDFYFEARDTNSFTGNIDNVEAIEQQDYLTYEKLMTPHPHLNFAYVYTGGTPVPESSWSETSASSINHFLLDTNRVQATEINNPYIMPAENSYRVGSGSIVGFGANTVPVSEGQFGQYPLIVFSSNGIWAMNISGNPDVLIENIVPLSNMVCNNPAGILSALNNIIFTTEEGLFTITGRETGEIAEVVEGSIKSPLDDDLDYSNWIDDPNHYEITDYISSVDFKKYLPEAKMAYDSEHQELIISNSTYSYSYIYSLKYNLWYKISESFEHFVQDYPAVCGYQAGEVEDQYRMKDLTEEENTYQPLHILTRPIKLQIGFKKIMSAILRGYTHTKAGKGFGFLLFGSVDNQEYHVLNGRKPLGEIFDIDLQHTPLTCKYFIIVAGGLCDEDTFITHFDLLYEPKFQNKLR